ncbi:membrane protease subunit 1 [Seminavis robusta]|uniref:Mitochondrial inner membrane protease subunit n=1 Tax=Seminavis robusta TaxID=568900 RepID=A0A9N8DSR8_9STRA|nr:membrane protease subunit 1 [Seminavis robusta]|eukprot:Sro326_g118150.1 membrane protease subunit 1 (370) ;mRNA; r:47831-48940
MMFMSRMLLPRYHRPISRLSSVTITRFPLPFRRHATGSLRNSSLLPRRIPQQRTRKHNIKGRRLSQKGEQNNDKGFWNGWKDDMVQELREIRNGIKDLTWKECQEMARDSGILLYRLALAYGCYYFINEYGFFLVMCDGPSMLPTMQSFGEIILVERITPKLYGMQGGCATQERIQSARQLQREHSNPSEWHQPYIPINEMPQEGKWTRLFSNIRTGISVGDIVVAENPLKPGTVCKRVIGLPGDEIILKRSQFTASHFLGRTARATARQRKRLKKVPDGHVWLEGDNSMNSNDSRNYGTVPASMILGRVILRVWPPSAGAILERAMGPQSASNMGAPRWSSQASSVLPAGYDGQRIVKKYRETKKEQH